MKFRISEKRKNGLFGFESILPDIINEFELEKSFTIEKLAGMWSNIVSDIISTHSKPDRIFKNILFIIADHSVYAHEIIMMKDIIKERVNAMYSFEAISKIKVEIKNLDWKKKKV